MSGLFLGVDTSNYTTSLALCKNGKIIANEKLPVYVKDGERGVRQSDAVFSHVKNLPLLFEKLGAQSPDAIGVSVRPRSVEGSYMPCFLAGYSVARSISEMNNIKFFEFAHQQGHVMAALYSAGRTELWDSRFIAFHVSGGTTEMLIADMGNITTVGGTLDLNAGQVIDRVGVMLGMKFPCGAELERIAAPFDTVDCISHVRGLECNLSGLENKAADMIEKGVDSSSVAAFTLKSILRTLKKLTENSLDKFGEMPVLYAGGVMSNKLIQCGLANYKGALFSEPQFSSDNAAGIALLCEKSFEKQ